MAELAGRYVLEREVGRGGMAIVYLARDVELERPVAVKLLDEGPASDPTLRKRFLREARVAARLSHPHVVTVYDAGDDGGRPYIVMEYVEGETLAQLLRRRGRLPPHEATALAAQAVAGLACAHAAGLVHRDVKPGNLILRSDGTLKVADFGIARAAEATALTQAGAVLGTAAYLSPEQAAGGEVTAATDVYSLGCVLYELLGGRPPYELDSLAELVTKQAEGAITPLRGAATEVSPRLEELVMRCLARNPAFRPSAAELARELTPPGPDQRATPSLPAAQDPRAHRRIWLAIAAALVLALAGASAGVLATRGGSSKPPRRAPAIAPIAQGSTPQQQAANLAAWLRRYSHR